MNLLEQCFAEAREARARHSAAYIIRADGLADYEIARIPRQSYPTGSCFRCGSRHGLCRHTGGAL